MTKSRILEYESKSLNAWPSLRTLLYDGWILRLANGYTKRANSINPLHSSTLNIDKKIEHCIDLFQKQEIRVVFKLTPETTPDNLDLLLEKRGFEIIDITSVQTVIVDTIEESITVENREKFDVQIYESLNASWFRIYCDINEVAKHNQDTLHQMLSKIQCPTIYVSLHEINTNDPIACGIGVVEQDTMGIFGVAVTQTRRRQGYGFNIMKQILQTAKSYDIKSAYLQVVVDNIPAQKLYAKLGFQEIYQYWYRVLPKNTLPNS